VLLAELEIFHSRPIAPTRRVSLGRRLLPVDPPPGFGGILLGGIVATHLDSLDPDLLGELGRLITDLEAGRRVPQPRLRHRFQADRHGLARSRHRLVGRGDGIDFEFGEGGAPASQILGAVYAAGRADPLVRPAIMDTLRRAVRWQGAAGPSLIAYLSGTRVQGALSAAALAHPERWALTLLGFEADGEGVPVRADIQRRFRTLVREAHPDHGAGVKLRTTGLVLFPGAGTSADHPSLKAIEAAVSPLPVERVDFGYRKAGRKAPPRAETLIGEVEAVVAGRTGLVLGGRSMGGRVASMAVAAGTPAAGLVLVCYPLHPPGRPEKLRVEHLPKLDLPVLFVSGTRDAFGTPDELEAHTATIPGPVTHVWLEGKGHDLRGADQRVAEAVRTWLAGGDPRG
jgi:predicted alpha/beta-hydrolase family hydrolase